MSQAAARSKPQAAWLFSPAVDLTAFLGSAAVSLGLLAWGAGAGLLEAGETPDWAWVSLILLVDVAHVYATGFRVYFDREELGRRPWLYGGVPLACFVLAAAAYSEGALLFWRMLAYLAVFHFVRQQYGWVALYRAKAGEREPWGRRIDTLAIYMCTLYPLIHWHASMPKRFSWFVDRDFLSLPLWTATVALVVYIAALAAYAVNSLRGHLTGRGNPGKDIVVVTTAVCWYVGIVAFNSDFAFSVTNVVIHGVPYIILVWWYMLSRQKSLGGGRGRWTPWKALVVLVSTIWVLAYVEELVWDRTLYHQRSWLFGSHLDPGPWDGLIVPLLAVPQLTHYVLDGFIWRRRSNPDVRELVDANQSTPATSSAP